MKHKTVHVLGYEFDSLPAHVKISGRGSGATLRVACQRAIADLFTQHQLRHKQTGAFKLSVVVIAETRDEAKHGEAALRRLRSERHVEDGGAS